MGGKRSMFSFFGIRKARVEHADVEPPRLRKVRPSDEDRGRNWYAEQDIDRKTQEFITKVHRQMQSKE